MAAQYFQFQTPKGTRVAWGPSQAAAIQGFKSSFPGLTYSAIQQISSAQAQPWTSGQKGTVYGTVPSGMGTPAPAAAPASAPTPYAPAAEAIPQLAGPTPTEFATAQTATQQAETSKYLEPYKAAQSEYIAALQRQQSPLDIYRGMETEMGIPAQAEAVKRLQAETYKVEDLLKNLPANILERTREMDVSQAQRERIQAFESKPLYETYGTLTTGLGREQQAYSEALGRAGQMTGYAMQGQEQGLRPYQEAVTGTQYQVGIETEMLSDRMAREQTGYTQERQEQWERLQDQITRGRQLSDREWQQASDLAAEARDFARQKEIIKLEASTKGASQTASERATALLETRVKSTASALASQAGPDGYVHQNTFNNARRTWVSQGYGSSDDFNAYFSGYANPSHLGDYGLHSAGGGNTIRYEDI